MKEVISYELQVKTIPLRRGRGEEKVKEGLMQYSSPYPLQRGIKAKNTPSRVGQMRSIPSRGG